MRGHVLLDNFTLQGSYFFLKENDHRPLPSLCLATLIDALILYEKIYVPSLSRSSHYGISGNGIFGEDADTKKWKSITDELTDVVSIEFIDSDIPRLGGDLRKFLNPSYQMTVAHAREVYAISGSGHFPSDDDCFPSYDPHEMSRLIEAADGFRPFEEFKGHIPEIARIDPLLYRDYRFLCPQGSCDDEYLFKLFVGFHLYYTDYCVELARTRRLHYLPNPTRVKLINESSFFQDRILLENVRRDILTRFEGIRKHHVRKVTETISLRSVSIDAPLLFNYVTSKASDPSAIIHKVKQIRNSREATAYRRFCREIEQAIEGKDLKSLAARMHQITTIVEKWQNSLALRGTKRKINVKVFNIDLAGVEVPDIVLFSKELAAHFIFLHELVTTL